MGFSDNIKRRISYFQPVEILHFVQDDMKNQFFHNLPKLETGGWVCYIETVWRDG
jgi:hypothetical protein